MVLPNATLFPHTLLPLRIFEPHYRKMLKWCLEQQRMFCVALLKPGVSAVNSPEDFHHVGGLGLIRACVGRSDGTSDLVLQGLARVRFTRFIQERPFWIADFQELLPEHSNSKQTGELVAQLLQLCEQLRVNGLSFPSALETQLANAPAPDLIADLVAHTLLHDPQRRQQVLDPLDVRVRLQALIRHLSEETVSDG